MSRLDPQANVLNYGQNSSAVLGHYRLATGGVIFPAEIAASILFAFRWGDATRLCVIERLKLSIVQTVAFTANTTMNIQTQVCRSWTASDTGGTAVTPTGNQAKMRANMGTSLLTDARIATVPGGLAAGTRTPDGNVIQFMPYLATAAAPLTALITDEWNADAGSMHPLVFAQNEGIEVFNGNVVPAAGGCIWSVAIEWAEVEAF